MKKMNLEEMQAVNGQGKVGTALCVAAGAATVVGGLVASAGIFSVAGVGIIVGCLG